jgi:uncharacterized protein YjlB
MIVEPARGVEAYPFADDGRIPNSRLPLLAYRRALPAADRADAAAPAFERLFARHGWSGAWRDGVFPFRHFHSTTHEVLGVAGGWAELRFGGEAGRTLRLAAGDAVVIPAGVGHKLERSGAGFLVVGAYPGGRGWDVRRGEPGERDAVMANLARVPLPELDPIRGTDGPVPNAWAEDPRRP